MPTQNLAKRLTALRIERDILKDLRTQHQRRGCTRRGCKRCATFRRQLDSLDKEENYIEQLLASVAEASY